MAKNNKRLSFSVIAAAVRGDVDAINKVLAYYDGYISRLSARPLYDDYGYVAMVVDDGLRRRLETKLITKILKFKIV
jgi:hypothetical protein